MANPVNITWSGPTAYVDGTPYGQADYGGFEIELNGVAGVAVPVAWNTNNLYTLPIAGLPNIKQGTNSLRMRTVAANGQVSAWTAAVTFPWASVPNAPTNLKVA